MVWSKTSPSSPNTPGLKVMYASISLNSGELQKASTARRLCCPTAVPMLPGEAPMIPEGLWVKEFVPQGRLAPVDGVLERPRDGAVVLGGHKENRVDLGDRFLQGAPFGRVVRIEVVAVERQVLDRDFGEGEVGRSEPEQRPGERAVDRFLREAADEIPDLETGHERSPGGDARPRRKAVHAEERRKRARVIGEQAAGGPSPQGREERSVGAGREAEEADTRPRRQRENAARPRTVSQSAWARFRHSSCNRQCLRIPPRQKAGGRTARDARLPERTGS